MRNIRRISIAPMMDCTDRHYRYFMRGLTRYTLLYTEMITANAIQYGDAKRFLAYHACEHPIALQLGGSEVKSLVYATKLAEDYGYDEVNLNVGCPSSRVSSGSFGVCLMKDPARVAQCVSQMQAAVNIPVTVKTRLGVDEQDSYEFLTTFIDSQVAAGCEIFIIHARKAWLNGLSPKENRNIPPLIYDRVYQLKRDYPHLHIGINGGINTLAEVGAHLKHVDEVMIGREAYSNPSLFAQVDQLFYDANASVSSSLQAIEHYMPYMAEQLSQDVRLRSLIRPLIGLFPGVPGARLWRRYLSTHGGDDQAGVLVVKEALKQLYLTEISLESGV
jgi:tRNA-dihydrouridine synthase A